MPDEQVAHCLSKIEAIAARGADARRDLLQLGYNLGRLSELTGLGREPFWDDWKGPAVESDAVAMTRLARALRETLQTQGPPTPIEELPS